MKNFKHAIKNLKTISTNVKKPCNKPKTSPKREKLSVFCIFFEMPGFQAKHLGKTSFGWPLLKGNLAGGKHARQIPIKIQQTKMKNT